MTISKSIDDTKSIAEDFLGSIEENKSGAYVVGLEGDLGSGKTAFSKELAKLLGVKEIVTSPTFVIEKIYKLKGQKFDYLIHIDAYRLEESRELEVLGFKKLLEDPKNLILIEWPERVKEILPKNMKKIYFEFIDENVRKIEVIKHKT